MIVNCYAVNSPLSWDEKQIKNILYKWYEYMNNLRYRSSLTLNLQLDLILATTSLEIGLEDMKMIDSIFLLSSSVGATFNRSELQAMQACLVFWTVMIVLYSVSDNVEL